MQAYQAMKSMTTSRVQAVHCVQMGAAEMRRRTAGEPDVDLNQLIEANPSVSFFPFLHSVMPVLTAGQLLQVCQLLLLARATHVAGEHASGAASYCALLLQVCIFK